jgi:hypothetical protein
MVAQRPESPRWLAQPMPGTDQTPSVPGLRHSRGMDVARLKPRGSRMCRVTSKPRTRPSARTLNWYSSLLTTDLVLICCSSHLSDTFPVTICFTG